MPRGSPTFGGQALLPLGGGGSISFPAAEDYLAPPLPSRIAGDKFTVEALVRLGNNPAADQVIYEQHSPGVRDQIRVFVTAAGLVSLTNTCDFVSTTVTSGSTTVTDGSVHHIAAERVTTPSDLLRVWVDGVVVGSTAMSGNLQEFANHIQIGGPFEGDLSEIVTHSTVSPVDIVTRAGHALTPWKSDTSDETVTRVLDILGWASALRDITDGVSTLQGQSLGGKALEHLQRLDRTEGGLLYVAPDGKITFRGREFLVTSPGNASQLTFGHGAGETPFTDPAIEYDDTNIYTQARVGREGGTAFVIENDAAVTASGPRSFEETGFLSETDADVIDRGNWIVTAFSDARIEMRGVTVNLNHPDVVPAAVLDLRVGDLVTVRHIPRVGEPVNEFTCRVGQMSHDGQSGKRWTVTLQLYPWDADIDQPWILDDATYSVLGSTTKLGF